MALLAAVVSVVSWCLLVAPSSRAADKFAAPRAPQGDRTAVTVRKDYGAGEHRHQSIQILENGKVVCQRVEFRGAIFARVVGHVTLTTVGFDSCVYLGRRAELNASSCGAIVTSGGLAKFTNRGSARCDLRVEVPGCTVHLGKGSFLELGYNNVNSATETTGLTEPIPFGGTAIGAACLSPGPSAIGEYSGYLRLAASRDGAKKPIIIIL